jgi:hypothetical protein
MSASVYDSLCSQLENSLKTCLTGTEISVDILTQKILNHYAEMEKHGLVDCYRRACVAAILKHDLIPLHMECVSRLATAKKSESADQSCYFFLPLLFAQLTKKSEGNVGTLLPLRDCLMKHDYVTFLLSQYLALKLGDWQAATPVCSLVEFILVIEEAEILQRQQQQPLSSSTTRGASRRPQPAFISKKMESFLLQHLSQGLREVLPPDQAPPGALASLSQGKAGQFLGRDILNSMMGF